MNTIEFSCYSKEVIDLFPPIAAKKLIPEWYKDLSRHMGDKDKLYSAQHIINEARNEGPSLTIKGCVPVRDYITSGYIIRSPTDMMISHIKNEDKNIEPTWWWCTPQKDLFSCGTHPFQQLPIKLNGTNNSYIKLTQPWGIKTPKGYSCMFFQPEFFFETRFKLLPGIVDTDTYTSPVNFPGLITAEQEDFTIEAGTPLMVVFPFKREEWKAKINYKPIEEVKSFKSIFWTRTYERLFHTRKSYD